jgi:hypothetical protein
MLSECNAPPHGACVVLFPQGIVMRDTQAHFSPGFTRISLAWIAFLAIAFLVIAIPLVFTS